MNLATPNTAVELIQDAAVRYCAARAQARRAEPDSGNVVTLAHAQVARIRRELHLAGLAYDRAADRARLDRRARFPWRRFYFAA